MWRGQGRVEPTPPWRAGGPHADAVVASASFWPVQEVTGLILLFSQSLGWCVAQRPLMACTSRQEDGDSKILGVWVWWETTSQ